MQKILEDRISDIQKMCLTHGVKRLYVFGSVVSDHFRDDSDIDLLISFFDNLSIDDYTNNYFALQYGLRELLHREIDLITERTLSNPYFIQSIDESKTLIYEA